MNRTTASSTTDNQPWWRPLADMLELAGRGASNIPLGGRSDTSLH